jgi:hypothetical protein
MQFNIYHISYCIYYMNVNLELGTFCQDSNAYEGINALVLLSNVDFRSADRQIVDLQVADSSM